MTFALGFSELAFAYLIERARDVSPHINVYSVLTHAHIESQRKYADMRRYTPMI